MPLRRIVGVMGSSTSCSTEVCNLVGSLLAASGHDLLTGGGTGSMCAVAAAFVAAEPRERRGVSIGILPGIPGGGQWGALREGGDAGSAGCGLRSATPLPPDGYPNAYVELAIRTHLGSSGTSGEDPSSRNHINVLTSDAVIALPGGPGTASEVRLALTYGKQVCLCLINPGDIIAEIGRGEALLEQYGGNQLTVATSIEAVDAWLQRELPSAKPS